MPSCKSLRWRADARYISFFTLYGGQFTFLTQLLTLNYLLYSPPTQQHSFFRNLPLYSWGNRVFLGGWEFLFSWLQLIVSSKCRFYLFLTFVMLPCTDVEKLILMPSRDYSLGLRRWYSNLDTRELNATLGLVPLINRRKLHIVLLTEKCLDSSVPPYLNNSYHLNASVHTVSTRLSDDIRIPKVNQEVSKISFRLSGAMEFNDLPCHIKWKESSQRELKTFSSIRW